MNNSSIWLVWFLLFAVIALLVIPRRYLVRLLPFGITAGFLLTLAILLLAVPLLNLWAFDTLPADSVLGIPLSLPLVAIPVMMLFAYFIPDMQRNGRLIIWITAFSVVSTLVQGLSQSAGIIRFVSWDLLAALLLTFSKFALLSAFVIRYGAIPEQQGN